MQWLEFVEGAPWGLSIVRLCPRMALSVTPALGESCCPFSSLERFPTRAQRLNHLFSTAHTPSSSVLLVEAASSAQGGLGCAVLHFHPQPTPAEVSLVAQ